tara:strand:- start:1161 stop:1916 length:756 start_codon:yes stop_codon:yes gene_type:complete
MKIKQINSKVIGLIIPLKKTNGFEQMAIDIYLFNKYLSRKDVKIIIRFYEWDGWWLSIGKNQNLDNPIWQNLSQKGLINIVRRPSGGNAVLHGGGLTYSFLWSEPPYKKKEAYNQINNLLINTFSREDLILRQGCQSNSLNNENCFSSSTQADLVDQDGFKRIGSAQFWKRGQLLQHGEIYPSVPKKLWYEIFGDYPPPSIEKRLSNAMIESLFLKELKIKWPQLDLIKEVISEEDNNKIKKEAKNYMVKF